jgi:PAS domain S-box-containing protein
VTKSNSAIGADEIAGALDAAKIGVWAWDRARDHLRWSARVAELFGMAPESFEGSFVDFSSRLHADDAGRVKAVIDAALEVGAQDYHVEYRVPQPDGTERWLSSHGCVQLSASGKPIGMMGAVIDITERKAALDRQVAGQERYRLFTELASDYIYVVDFRAPALAPSIVAGSFERTTGYTPDEVAALGGWPKVMHPADHHTVEPLLKVLGEGRPFISEYRIVTKDGRTRWLRDRALPNLDPGTGELAGITGGVQDITERKALEEQLMHAQKMKAVAHLAGAVAHDLNNLLTVMYGAAAMMKADLSSERGKEAFDHLNQATQRAAELTRSLLTFGRRQVAEPRVIRLADIPEQSAPMLRRALGERVRLVVEDAAGDARVSADPSQFELALLNLAVNARDAMGSEGTVTLRSAVRQLSADDAERPPELAPGSYGTLEVRDTGSGIPREVMNHIFEPFFTTKDSGRGTGLGLATVHGVVVQHDGAIVANSEVGRGTSFVIYLPLSGGDVDRVVAHEPRNAVGGTERILVVEDDALVRRSTLQQLEELGYSTTGVGTAEDAAPLSGDHDLILSDVRLPGMSGTELALALEHTGPPVLLMSGFVEDEEQRSVIATGRVPFIAKPFSRAGLARRLREALEGGPPVQRED